MARRPRRLRAFLLFLTLVLLIALGLSFFYLPLREQGIRQTVEPEQKPAAVSVSDVRCTPTAPGFRVCGDVRWGGGAYAKAYIAGGEALEDSPQQAEPFTYCQPVGAQPGFRLFRAFVYNQQGTVLVEQSEGVSCERPSPVTPAVSDLYSYTKKAQFSTESQFGRPEGTGTVSVSFPDSVVSCEVNGTFFMDDGGRKMGKATIGIQEYCHGATGTLSGVLTGLRQWVMVDPSRFRWDDGMVIDPPPSTYEGYLAYVPTCDLQYQTKQRYYTTVVARGLGTRELVLDWYYKNDDTQPRVNFDLDFRCLLRRA